MNAPLPLTKYHQIYLVLREQIVEGQHAKGVPPETELARHFGVGRVTVRRALEQLVQEGLIVRSAGRGTFPKPRASARTSASHPVQAQPTRLAGLMENIVSASRSTTVKVLDWRTVTASDAVARALEVPVGTPVRKAVRCRSLREGPLSHITTYMPLELAKGITRRHLSAKPLLQLLQESGVELGRAQQTISARQADAQVARELGVSIGSALLLVKRLVRDANERPVQFLEGLYVPDRYEYQMEVSRIGGLEARIAMRDPGEGAGGTVKGE